MSIEQPKDASRRQFMKASGTLAASIPFISAQQVKAAPKADGQIPLAQDERIVHTCSTFDCGGKCDIRAHVRGNQLVRISTINDEAVDDDMPLMRACVRGRGYRRFVNHPDRLKYPMKRVGKRGEGKFERISWDEATSIIASESKRLAEQYGPSSRHIIEGTGAVTGALNGVEFAKRLFNLTGGFLHAHGNPSTVNAMIGTIFTYGENPLAGSSLETLRDSELIILWGHNPAETVFGNSNHFFQELKRAGKRIIVIDPRFSDSVAAYADEWIPLKPTSDSALVEAMAYVIFEEGLQNQSFIDKYSVGVSEASLPDGVPKGESMLAYLNGDKGGVKKTPEWAEPITGVPAATIRRLAREYAKAKPAALLMGWGPSRHYRGEHMTRSTAWLPVITGNVGVSGGSAGAWNAPAYLRFPVHPDNFENPVGHEISFTQLNQAIADYQSVGPHNGLQGAEKLDAPVKMVMCLGSNYLVNQNQNINKAAKILEDESKCELIVVSDLYMTPSAKYADILLPETSFAERWNFGFAWGFGDYVRVSEPLLKPEFERRSDYDWLLDVARKLGVEKQFGEGLDEHGWVKKCWTMMQETYPDENLPNWDGMLKKRTHLFKSGVKTVAYQPNIDDHDNQPFLTESGKIEIFSKALYDMQDPAIPALSHYQPSPESFADKSLSKEYPLQLITWKPANRANSTMYNNPWMQEVKRQELWINPIDAQARGIKDDQSVRVINGRGVIEIPAKVTPRIIPGTVGLANGAWRQLDKNGVDKGGCANTLSSDLQSPIGKGNANKTMLVEVSVA
ncbi:DMSO/selenate family reductase complex A subunit [Paraferrimonas sedimenticola]|uniref:Dimethyl sulfoxide reductase subunit A n=1 Tax=Paraferrimonas sedimenticola TaxID=375674 RepID=A0AA37RTY0_9GAMM|nr:DMSO/selenate family reductase complex A subunit [Paraferrimonas sedimenticola]GLP95690.1 dimethyl sulfoxide reductase subunit A [Paraferrimonas sedimenticola]